jgi:undecaprenyl-phosphate galactose phosphotransferase
VFAILYLGKFGEQVSRTVLVVMSIISFPVLPVIRINMKRLLISTGLLKSKALVIGAGKTGELIFRALKRDPNLGLDVVGFLDDSAERAGKKIGGVRIHGGVDKAHNVGRCRIEDVIIAMPECEEAGFCLSSGPAAPGLDILFIPDLLERRPRNLQHFFQEQAGQGKQPRDLLISL